MKGSEQPRLSHKFAVLQHNHKKRKNTLETRAVLLVFWLEFEISGVAVQEIHRNSKKAAYSDDFLFSFHFPFLLLQRVLRQLYKSLQMKKIITNGSYAL